MRKIRVAGGVVGLIALWAAISDAQLRKVVPEITPMVETDGVHSGSTVRGAFGVKLPEGFHVQSNKPRDPLLIPTELRVTPPEGVNVAEIVFPPSIDLKQEGADQPLAVFERDFTIGVRLTLAGSLPQGDLAVPFRLRYQACDDKMCFAPTSANTALNLKVVPAGTPLTTQYGEVLGTIAWGTGDSGSAGSAGAAGSTGSTGSAGSTLDAGVARLDEFAVAGTTGGYLGSSAFLKFIRNAEAGIKEAGLFEGRGPLAILLLVLLGGFALNLTPCVLPMIPINLAIIGAGAQAGSRQRGLLLGATYGGAMAVVYGVLGLIVILTAGTFGTINASPWFNLSIAVLFVLLGLAMFDVVTIDFSRWSSHFNPSASRGSFLLAFSMGAVAALLAGACVAPVVIQVVLFASNLYSTGTSMALALPFFLGIGMAIPWPIAGAGLASLPKPGPWMNRVKHAFGVLIIGTAMYYGYVAYEIFSSRWVDSTEVSSSVNEKLKEGWHASLASGLEAAARENKPVLIDMWATWCKNCLTMDKTTLQNAEVKAALDGYVKIKFQAEQPDEEPAKSVMQRYDAVGLPAYVILKPKQPGD
ncbi:MAG: protein-disulfide reductase DsbD family protein [Vicinamibacterales bacterium]